MPSATGQANKEHSAGHNSTDRLPVPEVARCCQEGKNFNIYEGWHLADNIFTHILGIWRGILERL